MALFNLYVLYKGTALPAAIVLFNVFLALSSASRPYLELYFVALYAIFFTILPIIVTAINDFDVSRTHAAHLATAVRPQCPLTARHCVLLQVPKSVAARTPELYTPGIRRVHFKLSDFLSWTADGIWAAAVAIFIPVLCVNTDRDGFALNGLGHGLTQSPPAHLVPI